MTAGRAPGRLLSTLPLATGRQLTGEVLMVGVTRATRRHGGAVIASVPLLDANPAMLLPACVTAVEWCKAQGARAAVVVAYADGAADLDTLAAEVAATLNVCAEQVHLPVLDTLRVVDGRWWSYECEDPACCPQEGTPIPTPEEISQP